MLNIGVYLDIYLRLGVDSQHSPDKFIMACKALWGVSRRHAGNFDFQWCITTVDPTNILQHAPAHIAMSGILALFTLYRSKVYATQTPLKTYLHRTFKMWPPTTHLYILSHLSHSMVNSTIQTSAKRFWIRSNIL